MTSMRIMALGLALVLAGVALPFLMVARFLEPDFFLGFAAHVASLAGLPLALYGALSGLGPERR